MSSKITQHKSHKRNNKRNKQHKESYEQIELNRKDASIDDENIDDNIINNQGIVNNNVNEDDEEAEINKLIVRHNEPTFSTPTMNITEDIDTKVTIGKNKILPLNRIVKNNFDIKTQYNDNNKDNINNDNEIKSQYNDDKEVKTQHKDDKEVNEDINKNNKNDENNNKDINNKQNIIFDNDDIIKYDNIKDKSQTMILSSSLMKNNDNIVVLYPNYNGPYKINKKVFRICYLAVVSVMLVTLLFIIMLQHFKKYLETTQIENNIDNNINKPLIGGNDTNTQEQTQELTTILTQQSTPYEDIESMLFNEHNKQTPIKQRQRDSKGRFVKINN